MEEKTDMVLVYGALGLILLFWSGAQNNCRASDSVIVPGNARITVSPREEARRVRDAGLRRDLSQSRTHADGIAVCDRIMSTVKNDPSSRELLLLAALKKAELTADRNEKIRQYKDIIRDFGDMTTSKFDCGCQDAPGVIQAYERLSRLVGDASGAHEYFNSLVEAGDTEYIKLKALFDRIDFFRNPQERNKAADAFLDAWAAQPAEWKRSGLAPSFAISVLYGKLAGADSVARRIAACREVLSWCRANAPELMRYPLFPSLAWSVALTPDAGERIAMYEEIINCVASQESPVMNVDQSALLVGLLHNACPSPDIAARTLENLVHRHESSEPLRHLVNHALLRLALLKNEEEKSASYLNTLVARTEPFAARWPVDACFVFRAAVELDRIEGGTTHLQSLRDSLSQPDTVSLPPELHEALVAGRPGMRFCDIYLNSFSLSILPRKKAEKEGGRFTNDELLAGYAKLVRKFLQEERNNPNEYLHQMTFVKSLGGVPADAGEKRRALGELADEAALVVERDFFSYAPVHIQLLLELAELAETREERISLYDGIMDKYGDCWRRPVREPVLEAVLKKAEAMVDPEGAKVFLEKWLSGRADMKPEAVEARLRLLGARLSSTREERVRWLNPVMADDMSRGVFRMEGLVLLWETSGDSVERAALGEWLALGVGMWGRLPALCGEKVLSAFIEYAEGRMESGETARLRELVELGLEPDSDIRTMMR